MLLPPAHYSSSTMVPQPRPHDCESTVSTLLLPSEKHEIAAKVHAIIDKFAKRGLRSLGVALQEVPEKSKESPGGPGGPWTFCGLLPLFDPPRHDSAETMRRALNLGVCVKMITGPRE